MLSHRMLIGAWNPIGVCPVDVQVAMARDHTLNPYQHTPAQLKRKYKKVAASLALVEDMAAADDEDEA